MKRLAFILSAICFCLWIVVFAETSIYAILYSRGLEKVLGRFW